MPTPSGKLKAGDRLQLPGFAPLVEVVERLGNDASYSVRVRRLDDARFPPLSGRSANGKTVILTEAAWHLNQGRWKLVKPDGPESLIVAQVQAANPDIEPARLRRVVELTLALAKRRK